MAHSGSLVHSLLADLGCVAVLRWLLHREGLRLRDLPGVERCRLASALKRSLGNIAVLAAAGVASNALQRPFYGGALPPQITIVRVPRWARVYGVLIWPALWVTTEELVYLGYALPRLEARLGSTRIAAALVILCWGPVQHPLLPTLPDRRYTAFRALTALPRSPRRRCSTCGIVDACSRSWSVTGLRMSRPD